MALPHYRKAIYTAAGNRLHIHMALYCYGLWQAANAKSYYDAPNWRSSNA